jgi:hypothetical protein
MDEDGTTTRHDQLLVEHMDPRRTIVPAVFYGDDLSQIPVPPAFYRDDIPPDPPKGDPHWREFPFFESMKSTHLLIAGIIVGVCLATVAHLATLLLL